MTRLAEPPEPPGETEAQLARTVDRLRSLPLDRLRRPGRDGLSPADRAHVLSRHFVDLAYRTRPIGAGTLAGDVPPELPRLGDHAAGDQLEVVVRDYLIVAATRADAPGVDSELVDAGRKLLEFRRSI